MPTLARLGNIQIRIFAEDHVPPHFHVVTSDGEVMVRIADLQVHEGSIDRKSLRTAIEWAAQNIALLEAEWSRLND
ncbi:MAG TPA: DUF4160 domain-containing protein [Roseiarcus sp.]|nr:DUF4160 domain-containing protein [Roseiarcus sp.]